MGDRSKKKDAKREEAKATDDEKESEGSSSPLADNDESDQDDAKGAEADDAKGAKADDAEAGDADEGDAEAGDADEGDADEDDADEGDADEDDADEKPAKPSKAAAKKAPADKAEPKPSDAKDEAAAKADKKTAASGNPVLDFFWMAQKLDAARQNGFDKDKPGWSHYELARDAVVAAQRLSELSEAKPGVLLLNRVALVLMARAELERAGVEGHTWSEFTELDTAKPMLESLSDDERQLIAQVLGPDGLEQLAGLPKDRRGTAGKALASVAGKLYEQLEREANRVASVLYLRWLKIVGVAVAVLVVIIGGYTLVARSRTGPNLALGATVRVSSSSKKYGKPPAQLVDGNRNDLGFHTNKQKDPWVEIDLGKDKRFRQVIVYNRATNPQRAVPMIIEVSKDMGKGNRREWKEVAKREEKFDVWTADFPAKSARYVRLKLLKKEFFHLAEVEIH